MKPINLKRHAVTGKPAGPSFHHLLEVLGKEKALERMERALERFAREIGLAIAP